MPLNDWELLQEYIQQGSEKAFETLVSRHVGLVYSAALRQVRSPDLAEEVAQSVFIDLARQARKLKQGTILAAWLYRVTCSTAIDMIRAEARRQMQEQNLMEHLDHSSSQPGWAQLEPLLEEAMESLDEEDRSAVLLRYFENLSLREVGNALGTSEDAAQKRVARAVDRLKDFFARRRVAVGSASLAALLSSHAVQAAPAAMATTIFGAATLLAPPLILPASHIITKAITMTTVKKLAIAAVLTVAVGTAVYERLEIVGLKQRGTAANQTLDKLAAESLRKLDRSATGNSVQPASLASFSWSSVESPDYKVYIANLRQIACPEKTIRDIIFAEIDHLYAGRATNLVEQFMRSNRFEYWLSKVDSENRSLATQKQYKMALNELAAEKRRVINELLGIDLEQDDFAWAPRLPDAEALRRSLDFLPAEKRKPVESLLQSMVEEAKRLQKPGEVSPEAMLEVERLRAQFDQQLRALLTPEEKLAFDLRNSSAAQILRRELSGVSVNEQEFLKLFELRKGLEEKYGQVETLSSSQEILDRIRAESNAESELKEALGTERYNQYVAGKDPSYRNLTRYAEIRNIPPDTTMQLYSVQKAVEGSLHSPVVYGISPEDGLKIYSRFKQETERELVRLLGEQGYLEFKASRVANWLRNLDRAAQTGESPILKSIIVPAKN